MKNEIEQIIAYKTNFLKYHEHTENPEIREMVEYIKKKDRFGMMNCELTQDYSKLSPDIFYNKSVQMFYLLEGGHKLYFANGFDEEKTLNMYRSLKREQDIKSPHRYLEEEDINIIKRQKAKGKKIVLYELGAMEGMFSLGLIDMVDEVHIFECSSGWISALKNTFYPWKDKVKIVNKSVSDYSDRTHICMNDYCVQSTSTLNTYIIVKMDIEGNERFALKGMKDFLEKASHFMLFVCTYHKQDDEEMVRKLFSDCQIRNTQGYFCFYQMLIIKNPMYIDVF